MIRLAGSLSKRIMRYTSVLQSMRPAFLVLTPACVFLGVATALVTSPPANIPHVFLVLAGALCAHIGVNALNEYFDFRSGLDLHTHRTPFSGGSGALPADPGMAQAVLNTGIAALAVVVLVGVYLVYQRGMQLLPVGMAGLLLIMTYTTWINRYPLLCLLAPGLGFGPLMVVGTHFVLTGKYAIFPLLVSLVPFFLVNNLLLLNQYPDMQADSGAGRRHFPIAYGIMKSNLIYAAFALAAYVVIGYGIAAGHLKVLSYIAIIPAAFSMVALTGAARHGAEIGRFPGFLAANVAAAVLTPLLLAVSIVYDG